MAIDFPSSPAVNDTYVVGIRIWRWNGEGWERVVNAGQTVSVLTVLEGPFVQLVVDGIPQPFGLDQWTLLTHI